MKFRYMTVKNLTSIDLDGSLSYERALVEHSDYNIELLEAAVIKLDTIGKWIYYFACDIVNCDVDTLQMAMLTGDKLDIWKYRFALDIDGADTHKFIEAINDSALKRMLSLYY